MLSLIRMLIIEKLTKTLRDKDKKVLLFNNFNFRVKKSQKGEFIAIIGDNGIGKTTLLDLIAGIKKTDKGTITINNKQINKSRIGYVFQNYRQALFPWMNVIENISFPLKLRGKTKNERHAYVKTFCQRYGINVKYYEYPNKLSGGEYQLATVIRSLIDNPELVLLDEPFSSLDHNTSIKIQRQIQNISRALGVTVIMVSHRIDEAIFLSTRFILLGNCPTEIIDDFPNPLKYPRGVTILSSPESNLIRKRIYAKLKMK